MIFERDHLLDEARRATGLEDFGEPAFAEGLDALIASIGEDREIPETARAMLAGRLTTPLVQRLKLYADRRRYPEIAAQRIERPLIVIGLPRSGTTFLHALLAQDPDSRSPLAWQIGDPSPPPREESLRDDPRIAVTEAALSAIPIEYQRMHMLGARLPEECNTITMMGFCSPNISAAVRTPSYIDWYLAADARPAYAVHRHMLQHLQAFTAGRRWVLKAPPHMFHMAALLATYPDARIVFPHRDPAATLSSLASLIAFIRRWTYAEVDQAEVGREQLAMWAEAMDRTLAFRQGGGGADILDLSYTAIVGDPMGTVRRIYDRFDMTLIPAAEQAMQRFLAEKPKDKHGTHRYSIEDAGLSREAVRERFRAYLDARPEALG